MTARIGHGGAHTAPRPARDGGQRADLAQLLLYLLAVAFLVVTVLPPVVLVVLAVWFTASVLVALLLSSVIRAGRRVRGKHEGPRR